MSNPKTTATEFFRANKAPDKTTHIAVRKGSDVCRFVAIDAWCDYSSVETGAMLSKSFWDIFEVSEFVRAQDSTGGDHTLTGTLSTEPNGMVMAPDTPVFNDELMAACKALDEYDGAKLGVSGGESNRDMSVLRRKLSRAALDQYREMKK